MIKLCYIIYLFILLYCRYTKHHGSTHVVGIFYVQCSFSMGCITTTLCNQNPFNTPHHKKNNWVHSVIFEPQLKIQLTQSSYKVTSFLDFQPFLQGFQSVAEYLNDLIADIDDPTYY